MGILRVGSRWVDRARLDGNRFGWGEGDLGGMRRIRDEIWGWGRFRCQRCRAGVAGGARTHHGGVKGLGFEGYSAGGKGLGLKRLRKIWGWMSLQILVKIRHGGSFPMGWVEDYVGGRFDVRTAYDVSLNDDSWGHDRFDVISGSTSKTWERLDAGASVSHSFVLDSQVKGLFHGSPAVIKFRVPTKSALQEAFSTPIQPLDILADKPPEKKFEWAKRLLAKYGSLVSVLGLVSLFLYVLVSPSKSSGGKGSKKKR
ncbi:uncharacterized protein A4U43_C02F12000 [Asparagus officinalis]|uniref:Uncharacterized protein n=1 Tax=Asparagus officinalis TaxID=4686 RepID=A0A5P1FII6_ASPOF|nr:uncharacterized protein A4U43_C02F12000 [Asparagus officinalis]